ncbi:MAG: TIGR03790 family protein [Deltaproteobacteria bacterium]|nr:TIGR03790 family protein [Deltaproteobacteria bacterium]
MAPAGTLITPGDLIVIYNRNLVESKAVAEYYAQKRRGPWDHLLGVAVTTAEQMTRQEYEQNLLPPVRAAVQKIQTQGQTPALLLVYGLPLRVLGPPETDADRAFKSLTAARVKEFQGLVGQMLREVDAVTGVPPALRPTLTYPTGPLLEKAAAAINRLLEFLRTRPTVGESLDRRARAYALLIRLAGAAPEARQLMEKRAQTPPKERELLPNQEMLLWYQVLRRDLDEKRFLGILPDEALETATSIRLANGVIGELEFWEEMNAVYPRPQTTAAVDSELTLALAPRYRLAKWLPNPFNARFDKFPAIAEIRQKTLMVGRLDGPTPEIARRLVDDALTVEAKGLQGVFYIDARGLKGDDKPGGYAWYDHHLLQLYDLLKQRSTLKVVLDKNPALFPPGSCPDAALYCGWYSLRNYVPAFKWVKGAVGYHVASAEATTLKQKGSNVWCKRMLEEGVAATLGPVAEPYLHTFPLPDEFFPLLLSGQKPLLEVYFRTLPYLSWMQILIGDPLYTPFMKNPALRPEPEPQVSSQ